MKKLSLDDLKVESYASQVNESELAEVKGGTGWQCVIGAASLLVAIYDAWNDGSSTGSSGSAEGSSGTVLYNTHVDSMQVNTTNGESFMLYNVDIDSLRSY